MGLDSNSQTHAYNKLRLSPLHQGSLHQVSEYVISKHNFKGIVPQHVGPACAAQLWWLSHGNMHGKLNLWI